MMDTELIDWLQRSVRVHRKVSIEVGRPADHTICHVQLLDDLGGLLNFNSPTQPLRPRSDSPKC